MNQTFTGLKPRIRLHVRLVDLPSGPCLVWRTERSGQAPLRGALWYGTARDAIEYMPRVS